MCNGNTKEFMHVKLCNCGCGNGVCESESEDIFSCPEDCGGENKCRRKTDCDDGDACTKDMCNGKKKECMHVKIKNCERT